MKILIIDRAISLCETHLNNTNSRNTEVASFLTRYLLILWAEQNEKELKKIFKIHIKCTNSINKLNRYFEFSLDDTYRGLKISGISDLIKLFGQDYSDEWLRKCKQKKISRAITSWGILINERHDTAHVKGSNITFDDFIKHYEQSHIVLDVIQDVIKK
jgi:hypothetical protein